MCTYFYIVIFKNDVDDHLVKKLNFKKLTKLKGKTEQRKNLQYTYKEPISFIKNCLQIKKDKHFNRKLD